MPDEPQTDPVQPEPITLQRAVSGIGDPKNFVKLGVHGFNLGLIVLVILGGLTVFNWFFPKKNAQVQKQTSSVTFNKDSGVQAVTIVNSQEQNKQKKTVGLVGTVSSVDAGIYFVKYINDNWAVEVGPRYKFNNTDGKNNVVPEIRVRYDFY